MVNRLSMHNSNPKARHKEPMGNTNLNLVTNQVIHNHPLVIASRVRLNQEVYTKPEYCSAPTWIQSTAVRRILQISAGAGYGGQGNASSASAGAGGQYGSQRPSYAGQQGNAPRPPYPNQQGNVPRQGYPSQQGGVHRPGYSNQQGNYQKYQQPPPNAQMRPHGQGMRPPPRGGPLHQGGFCPSTWWSLWPKRC